MVTSRTKQKKAAGTDGSTDEVWYLALRKLHIVQGPGVKPSSIRFYPGQRFALDGDEAVDVEALLRTGAIKIYEDSDYRVRVCYSSQSVLGSVGRGTVSGISKNGGAEWCAGSLPGHVAGNDIYDRADPW